MMKRWLIALLIAGCVPAILYLNQFGFGLWEKHEDWAFLGAFFGGVLGPLFTFITVLLLIMTLRETKKANKTQLEIANKQYFDSILFNSITAIKQSIEHTNRMQLTLLQCEEVSFFNYGEKWVTDNFQIDKYTDLHMDAWETSNKFIRMYPRIYESEATLLYPVLLQIQELSDDEKDRYLTLLKGLMGNGMCFWLEVYGSVSSLELQFAMKNLNLSELPFLINKKVIEIESIGR